MPELHKAFITYKRVTKGNLLYIKFYTAPAEILYEEIKPPIQVVKIGLTKDMIIPEDIGQQLKIQKIEIPSFYANKRIIELLTKYCKLIGHKYPDHISSKCNGEDNVIPDVLME
ncbi:hypothetical protein H5410_004372 [Solanum commersonii]|uniref:Uncharacterized protein n=1 Tax=Solanum commersonii TaxID=4109 RepID=A0A9J6B894_SOLCO|nr:hypothetical protein H5410_004372 [Solanum commersonii]